MAGPAIRAWEIARALNSVGIVRLVSTVSATVRHDLFDVAFAADEALRAHVAWADVIVFQGHILRSFPWIKDSSAVLVADIYDPMHLEQLEQGKELAAADRIAVDIDTIEVLNDQLERADFMVCASEKQRDFWLGQLAGLARINPATYDADPGLRNLLDVAPFGVNDEAPIQRRHGIKGAVDGISVNDKVIIWGGGIYNWFDPLTLIRAVGLAAQEHPDLRLFFLGAGHPNPHVPRMKMVVEARKLADELELTNSVVFFNHAWVPYNERADYLLDADLGVSTHYDHLETAFSLRTRILDYLWASLPIISTDGDTFAQLIKEHNLGRVVPPEDVDALVSAINELMYGDEAHQTAARNVAELAQTMTWANSLKPLIAFCANPRIAPDRQSQIVSERNAYVNHLTTRVEALEGSTSWKITAPLRALVTFASKRRRSRQP
jgi:glycosyltransferase involved in cell wall biosynthesis